jgi:hypothetical protein
MRSHFLDGLALFSMGLLVGAPFFDNLGVTLARNDGPVLAIAGFVAILAMLEPDRPSRQPYGPVPRSDSLP